MIIIYDIATQDIVSIRAGDNKKHQHLQQRYMSKYYYDIGETKIPVPEDEAHHMKPGTFVTYTWGFAESFVRYIHVRNRPVARLIVADALPVIDFNPGGNPTGVTLSDSTHFTLGNLYQVDNSGG